MIRLLPTRNLQSLSISTDNGAKPVLIFYQSALNIISYHTFLLSLLTASRQLIYLQPLLSLTAE